VLALLAATFFTLPSAGGGLLVGAATSLREPVEANARTFEAAHPDTKLRLSYGASDVLAHVWAGAPLDVLLSAEDAVTAKLEQEGLWEKPRLLARNRLVVIARPEIAALHSAADLAAPAIRRIAVPERASTSTS
jgi:molybdate transport system substrate-binding protein